MAPTSFIPPQLQDDPDDWLTVDPQNLDEMLEKTMRDSSGKDRMDVDNPLSGKRLQEDRLASQQASKLKELAGKVEDFVEREGEVEGAIFDEYVLDTLDTI